jgi:anti-anti-sigma regulatory factor
MATIELKGNLTVSNAEKLHRTFLQTIQQNNSVTLDVSALEDIDVSILQLICSLYTSMGPNKKPSFSGSFAPLVRKRLYICGIIPDQNMDDASIVNAIDEKMGEAS